MPRLAAAFLVLLAAFLAAGSAGAASLKATGGIYAFDRFEGVGFSPQVLRFRIKTDAGTARFRIDGLPAAIRADRLRGTATPTGTVVSLTIDPSLPRTLGAVYARFHIVNLDDPAEPPLRRVIAIKTFASASRGQALFETRCMACHRFDGRGVGPLLNGIYGRRAGSLVGFEYSQALPAFGKPWNYTLLFAWLTDTQALVPGTLMTRSQVTSLTDAQRHDLIAYLGTISRR